MSQRLEKEVPKRLAELLALPQNRVKVQRQPAVGPRKISDKLSVENLDLQFPPGMSASAEASDSAEASTDKPTGQGGIIGLKG